MTKRSLGEQSRRQRISRFQRSPRKCSLATSSHRNTDSRRAIRYIAGENSPLEREDIDRSIYPQSETTGLGGSCPGRGRTPATAGTGEQSRSCGRAAPSPTPGVSRNSSGRRARYFPACKIPSSQAAKQPPATTAVRELQPLLHRPSRSQSRPRQRSAAHPAASPASAATIAFCLITWLLISIHSAKQYAAGMRVSVCSD